MSQMVVKAFGEGSRKALVRILGGTYAHESSSMRGKPPINNYLALTLTSGPVGLEIIAL